MKKYDLAEVLMMRSLRAVKVENKCLRVKL